MQAKLLKTEQAEYVESQWNGQNDSGYEPFGDRVLVMPDQAAAKSSGGIQLPDDLVERLAEASETGIIIAMGDGAFVWNSDRSRPYTGTKPTPGTRVYFDRYSGGKVRGDDGKFYRCMDDKAIGLRKV